MKWDMVKLDSITYIISGNAWSASRFKERGILPIIRIQNLGNNKDEKFVYWDNDFDEKFIITEGDMLLSLSGSIKVNIWSGERALLNQRILKISTKPGTSKRWLFWFLSSQLQNIASAGKHALVNNVSVTDIKNWKIPLPPLHIQEQIADTLDKADALRRKNHELLQKYDQLAQAIFYDMFGDPVRNEKSWEKTTLGKTCYMIKDGPHVSPHYVEKGVPFISVNNIIKGDWDLSKVKYISEEAHLIFKKRCNPTYGDVLYTKGGTTGFAKYVDVKWKFTNWVHIAVLKFDRNIISGRFLEYMLNTEHCYRQSQKYTRGIANRDLVLGEMKKIELFIPPINIQNNFAVLVEKLLVQKSNLKKTLDATYNLNNAYLKKYFS